MRARRRFPAPILLLGGLLACTAAVPEGPAARPGVARASVADLAGARERVPAGRIALEADVDRVEEAPDGVWIHLRDDGSEAALFVRLSFGAALREALGRGRARLEIEIVGTKETPEGEPGLEIVPFVISQSPAGAG